jgi:hypothetical protein
LLIVQRNTTNHIQHWRTPIYRCPITRVAVIATIIPAFSSASYASVYFSAAATAAVILQSAAPSEL